jgi:hypothetical protein
MQHAFLPFWYNTVMETTREFHPEGLSRRAEALTWVLALISLAAFVVLGALTTAVSLWQIAFVILMLFMAGSASLGNWMDRNTALTLKPDGVHFHNGLRDVSLQWDEIRELQVFPSQWGDRVDVVGAGTHFRFRTMSEFVSRGKTRSRMGFTQGEFIIQKILNHSGLQEIDQVENSRYYARP